MFYEASLSKVQARRPSRSSQQTDIIRTNDPLLWQRSGQKEVGFGVGQLNAEYHPRSDDIPAPLRFTWFKRGPQLDTKPTQRKAYNVTAV